MNLSQYLAERKPKVSNRQLFANGKKIAVIDIVASPYRSVEVLDLHNNSIESLRNIAQFCALK